MKIVESHTHGFIKTLESVENGLMKQINYLTQVSTGIRTSQNILYVMKKNKNSNFITVPVCTQITENGYSILDA